MIACAWGERRGKGEREGEWGRVEEKKREGERGEERRMKKGMIVH